MLSLGKAATATAKSLQSCLTLCDPIDSNPPGSSVPGILQARILEWVAISFSKAWKWKLKVKPLSCARLLATPWTAAYQAPPSVGFSRQEYWSGCHCFLRTQHYSYLKMTASISVRGNNTRTILTNSCFSKPIKTWNWLTLTIGKSVSLGLTPPSYKAPAAIFPGCCQVVSCMWLQTQFCQLPRDTCLCIAFLF